MPASRRHSAPLELPLELDLELDATSNRTGTSQVPPILAPGVHADNPDDDQRQVQTSFSQPVILPCMPVFAFIWNRNSPPATGSLAHTQPHPITHNTHTRTRNTRRRRRQATPPLARFFGVSKHPTLPSAYLPGIGQIGNEKTPAGYPNPDLAAGCGGRGTASSAHHPPHE